MAEAKMQAGVFLHSFAEESLEASIRAAGKSGLGLRVVQIGPVDDDLLIDEKRDDEREKIRRLLVEEEVKVGLGCVCFEKGKARRGGVEEYDSIEHIARTGGFGYTGADQANILAARIAVTKDHFDFLVYLREKGLISQDRLILSTHIGFIDRETEKREQIRNAVVEVANYGAKQGIYLAVETGAEQIQHAIQFIREIKLPNIGLNLDFANHILYRTQIAGYVLGVLGQDNNYKLVVGVHAKDAVLNPKARITGKAEGEWGAADVRFGTGIVPWQTIIPALYKMGYRGPVIIERESQDVDQSLMTAATARPAEQARLIAEARRGDIKHAMDRLLEMKDYVTR